ncbi:MAG: membrane protein insertase YidC, partial [Mycobacteriales bacterium]
MLDWLYTGISWVLLRWHDLFSLFLPHGSGFTWALSIVFLVITIRIILFPLFVKQFHSMRAMQELSPKMQAIRKKYADDRQRQTQEMMALQREAGANPLGGCLPMIVQAPVFLALYHVLRHLRTNNNATLYGWTRKQFDSAVGAKFFGAPIPATFRTVGQFDNANHTTTRVVIIVLLLLSCVATYITQWQNFTRNKANLEPQQMMIQRLMMYLIPVGLLFSGIVFGLPLGVLLYWLTNNVWTMGQQFYMLGHLTKKVEAKKAAATDTVETKPTAPKPGARPTRDKRGRVIPPDSNPEPTRYAEGTPDAETPANPGQQKRPAGPKEDRPSTRRPEDGPVQPAADGPD